MKNKKGFTLIELLAVIVILAIIALIVVPVILNILDKSNKSAFKDTAYGIVSAGELYFAEQQLDLNGMLEDKEFTLPSNELDIKGQVPEGKMIVNTEGKVALMVKNGRYCITKGFNDMDITITEDVAGCSMPSGEGNTSGTTEKTLSQLIVGTNECTTNMTEDACALGTMFTINVNDNTQKNFYVIKDTGDKVTLIMSENLGNEVAWHAGSIADNSYGPVTAIDYLDEWTTAWKNIPMEQYTYSGIAEDGQTQKYEDITRTMRVRILTYEEANTIKNDNNGTMPPYMYGGKGYWTSTANASNSSDAWIVSARGNFSNSYVYYGANTGGMTGVRPVIELSK